MASTNIAHSYVAPSDNEFRLAINVGIGGGPLQYYLSTLNAACNPTTWYGFGGGSTTKAPASTVPTAPAVAPGLEVNGQPRPPNCQGAKKSPYPWTSLTLVRVGSAL